LPGLFRQTCAKGISPSPLPLPPHIFSYSITYYALQKLQHTMKKAVVAEFALNGKMAHVAVVHLTSDKSENAVEKRKLQLEQLDSWMSARGTDNFMIGDFNFGDDGENMLPIGYDDVWNLLHPSIFHIPLPLRSFYYLSLIKKKDDVGYTYDVNNNTMAQVTTSKNKSSRFDRILCGSSRWAPNTISMFANQPVSFFFTNI
jgi:poly(A) polymerase